MYPPTILYLHWCRILKKPCADLIQMHALWNAKSGPQTENCFLISQPKHMYLGSQKNRFKEIVLLSTQNTFKPMDKKIITFLR